MSDQSDTKSERLAKKSKHSRPGCFLVGLILLPILYIMSVPWVVQIVRPAYLYGGRAGWSDNAVSAYTYPSELLYDMSDTYKSLQEPYGRFVRRTIERFSP